MLTGINKELIVALSEDYLRDLSGVKVSKFRIEHEDYLDELDNLEQSPYLERDGDKYRVNILSLSVLRGEVPELDKHLYRCGHLFPILRDRYKDSPEEPIKLEDLAKLAGLPERQVRKALLILRRAPIWGGYTSDLLGSDNVHVTPGESVLRYKSFDDVLDRINEWTEKSLVTMGGESMEEYTPPSVQEGKDGVFPEWYIELPENIRSLMLEIYSAHDAGLSALPSMGLRTVLDLACTELVGDVGGFAKKLDVMEQKGLITLNKKVIIENILEVGHASAHRGHFPSVEELKTVIDIVNHFLSEVYIMGPESELLKKSAPRRSKTVI